MARPGCITRAHPPILMVAAANGGQSPKGSCFMETPNRSIKCNVESCRNHCGSEDYCSLSCITVGTHECNPTQDACTDCMSFVKK